MKKIISLILVALMLVSVLPMTVGATEKPWQEVDASNTDTTNPVGENGKTNGWYGKTKQWNATKKYFAVQYEVYLSEWAAREEDNKEWVLTSATAVPTSHTSTSTTTEA